MLEGHFRKLDFWTRCTLPFGRRIVMLPKLASANPVESLAIHPVEPTCDQVGNHTYKNVRVNAKECELNLSH
jgi:hypothetical protein